MCHRLLIWTLIAGLRPFEVFTRKCLLSLLLQDRSKDFLEIKVRISYFSPFSLNYALFDTFGHFIGFSFYICAPTFAIT